MRQFRNIENPFVSNFKVTILKGFQITTSKKGVTSLSRELDRNVEMAEVKPILEHVLSKHLRIDIEPFDSLSDKDHYLLTY